MVATFNGNLSATIIFSYSPKNVSEETGLIAFYNELYSLVRSIPKHNVPVISGDMDAQIGKNVNHKSSVHNSSNRNGEHLTDFTLENKLTCFNTKFHKKGKLWTYTYANNTKAQNAYQTKKRGKPRVPWETLAIRKKACRRENCFQMQ